MDNLHVGLNFNLGIKTRRESNTTSKNNIMKLVKLQNVLTKCCENIYGKYSLAKFANFVYVCIYTCGNCYLIFEPKMVTISARNTNIICPGKKLV
jgi:hypothetical protein